MVNFLPRGLSELSVDEFGGVPLITFSTAPHDELVLFIRRCADVTLSAALLVILSPLLVAIAACDQGDLDGSRAVPPAAMRAARPAVHLPEVPIDDQSTPRTSKPHLAPFNEMDGPAFKMANDPRVTSVGRVLRRTSLDELPQLWNILRGDMSFVGPRPAVIEEVRQYEPWQRRRLSMKPGLTCLWQVSGRNELTFEEWMRLDLEYIDNWSLWLDIEDRAEDDSRGPVRPGRAVNGVGCDIRLNVVGRRRPVQATFRRISHPTPFTGIAPSPPRAFPDRLRGA